MKFLTLLLAPCILMAADTGGLNPADLNRPLKDSWPTYNGDYSGKRYSALTQIDRSNVMHLTLAWMTRVTPGAGDAGTVPNRTVAATTESAPVPRSIS